MEPNPIVEEIHEIRQQILARYNNDIHAYIDDCRRRQFEMGHEVVSGPQLRPVTASQDAARSTADRDDIGASSEQTQQDLLAALAQLRQIHSQWRLGQTVANVALAAGRTEAGGIWDLEDDEALAAARRLIEQHSEAGSDVA